MGRLLATTAVLTLLSASAAMAGGGPPPTVSPTNSNFTVLLGVGVEFGDGQPNVGVTGKVLAAPIPGLVAGGGATYFPGTNTVGLDLSAGLSLNGLAALGGYDFLNQQPEVSLGFSPTFTSCPAGYILDSGVCELNSNQSDRRVKRDVRHIATLSDGMKLYAFRYLWSETVYVGVIAQDLLEDPRWAHAVSTDEDGFYVVDYDAIDLVMVTLEDWEAHGLDAVVLGERPAAFLAERAA